MGVERVAVRRHCPLMLAVEKLLAEEKLRRPH